MKSSTSKMLKIVALINIFIVMIIADDLSVDNTCLEKLFESTLKCPLPDSVYNRSATFAFHKCSLKAIGALDENYSYIIPHTRNEVALVAYAEGIDDCASLGGRGTPIEYHRRSFSVCVMREMNILKIVYKCPEE